MIAKQEVRANQELKVLVRVLDDMYEREDLEKFNTWLVQENRELHRQNHLLRSSNRTWKTICTAVVLVAVAVVWPLVRAVVGDPR